MAIPQKHVAPLSSITITKHAEDRLAERAPHIPKARWRQWVYKARYTGTHFANMPEDIQVWVERKFKIGGPKKRGARVYDGYLFLFRGNHARVFLTLYPLPERFTSEKELELVTNPDDVQEKSHA